MSFLLGRPIFKDYMIDSLSLTGQLQVYDWYSSKVTRVNSTFTLSAGYEGHGCLAPPWIWCWLGTSQHFFEVKTMGGMINNDYFNLCWSCCFFLNFAWTFFLVDLDCYWFIFFFGGGYRWLPKIVCASSLPPDPCNRVPGTHQEFQNFEWLTKTTKFKWWSSWESWHFFT